MKNMFPLDFIKYLSYLEVQKTSKVVNVQIRFLRVYSKSFTATLYQSKFLVSECIFKYSLSLLELQVASHRRCSVKKRAVENLANFTGKYLGWSLFLINLQAWRSEAFLKRDSSTCIFPAKFAKFFKHLVCRPFVNLYFCNFIYSSCKRYS